MSFKEIKKEGKSVYKNDIRGCVGASLVSFIVKYTLPLVIFTIQFVCMQNIGDGYNGIISGIFGVLYLTALAFLTLPINVGAGMYFTAKISGKKPVMDKIFCAYKNLSVRGASAAVPFGIVILESAIGNILSLLAYKLLGAYGIAGATVVALLEIIVIIYTLAAYAPLTYVLETYDGISVGMAIGKTLRISSKNHCKIIRFYLSFILWYILGVLTCGLGFIWIMPYIRLASSILLKDLDRR